MTLFLASPPHAAVQATLGGRRSDMFFLHVHAEAGPRGESLFAAVAGQGQISQMVGLNVVLEVGAAAQGIGLLADAALPHHPALRPRLHPLHIVLQEAVQPAYRGDKWCLHSK
jgi:hypothetical protein